MCSFFWAFSCFELLEDFEMLLLGSRHARLFVSGASLGAQLFEDLELPASCSYHAHLVVVPVASLRPRPL